MHCKWVGGVVAGGLQHFFLLQEEHVAYYFLCYSAGFGFRAIFFLRRLGFHFFYSEDSIFSPHSIPVVLVILKHLGPLPSSWCGLEEFLLCDRDDHFTEVKFLFPSSCWLSFLSIFWLVLVLSLVLGSASVFFICGFSSGTVLRFLLDDLQGGGTHPGYQDLCYGC